ncbi:MAG: alginate export family protein [Methylohalobius sp. ZOD2]
MSHPSPAAAGKRLVPGLLIAALIPAVGLADDLLQPVADALQGEWGRIHADARYRYEYVDEENGREEAHASTLRLRLGYITPRFQGLQGYAEMEGNWEVASDRYNSLRNNETGRSVVADPQETELNQLWVSFNAIPDTFIKAGRQRIIFDNHRYIGNVGWRQLEQTYDAVRLTNNSIPDLTADVAFLWRVQNILSRTVDMNSPLLNVAYTGLPFGKLIAYGYWLDYDDRRDSANFALSSQTYGLRFDGGYAVTDKAKLLYTAEYARQMDYQRNPNDYATDYYHFMGGVSAYSVTLKGAIENLTADNGVGFRTPLATLHAFQGWADKFLATPPNGVRDVYASVGVNLWGATLLGVYHDFHDENGGVRYGQEFDALLTRTFGKHVSVLLKYAYYDAKKFSVDTHKVWGQVALNF